MYIHIHQKKAPKISDRQKAIWPIPPPQLCWGHGVLDTPSSSSSSCPALVSCPELLLKSRPGSDLIPFLGSSPPARAFRRTPPPESAFSSFDPFFGYFIFTSFLDTRLVHFFLVFGAPGRSKIELKSELWRQSPCRERFF